MADLQPKYNRISLQDECVGARRLEGMPPLFGKADLVIHDLILLGACGENAYVLLKTESSGLCVWHDVAKFNRQFVQRACAEALGVGLVYNWRSHPFVEATQFTADSLRIMFESHSFSGLETRPIESVRNVYGDLPGTYQFRGLGVANPHITLQQENSLTLLLNLAWSRSERCSDAVLDRLRSLVLDGTYDEPDLQKIVLTAEQVILSADHGLNARCAARELLGGIVCRERALVAPKMVSSFSRFEDRLSKI